MLLYLKLFKKKLHVLKNIVLVVIIFYFGNKVNFYLNVTSKANHLTIQFYLKLLNKVKNEFEDLREFYDPE